jgi:hypothetical protein
MARLLADRNLPAGKNERQKADFRQQRLKSAFVTEPPPTLPIKRVHEVRLFKIIFLRVEVLHW